MSTLNGTYIFGNGFLELWNVSLMQRSSLCWPESPFLEYRILHVPALAVEHARSVHLNQRIGFGLCFFTEMCTSNSLVSLPVFTLIFTHSCVPVAGLLWSNVESMNYWSQTAIVKALGCNSVLQSEAFCTKTGDFWSEHQVTPEFIAIKTSVVVFQGLTLCWTFPAHTRVKSRSGSFTGKGFKD